MSLRHFLISAALAAGSFSNVFGWAVPGHIMTKYVATVDPLFLHSRNAHPGFALPSDGGAAKESIVEYWNSRPDPVRV